MLEEGAQKVIIVGDSGDEVVVNSDGSINISGGGGGVVPASARTVKTDADFTTSSATFVDITGASASITIAQDSRILIMVTGNAENSSASAYSPVEVVIDSTAQGGTFGLSMLRTGNALPLAIPIGISFLSATLASGSHTVKLQLRATAGTSKVWASSISPLVLSLLEVPT